MSETQPRAKSVSVSLPTDVIEQIKDKVGRQEFSSYVRRAVEHQLHMEGLDELTADFERRNGRIPDDQVRNYEQEMFGATDGEAGGAAA
jgi:Arc/MetJ-type ribon-helix-helix transcriptional regulator